MRATTPDLLIQRFITGGLVAIAATLLCTALILYV